MLAACIGVFPSVEPPNLLRSFSASVSLPLPFRQPSSGIQRLCCIKLALLLHIFLGFFKRMENAHRHTLVPQFGFRYKPTKVYSLCLLRIFLTLFSNFLTNSNFFILSPFSKSTPPLFRFPCAPRCCLFTASRCSACGISLFRLTTSRVRLGLCFFFCCSGAFFCR